MKEYKKNILNECILYKVCSLFGFIVVFLFPKFCYTQDIGDVLNRKMSESVLKLSDTTMQKEIALFNRKTFVQNEDSLMRVALTEIPLRGCNDSSVYFWKDNWVGFDGIYVNINFSNLDTISWKSTFEGERIWGANGQVPRRKVDTISFVVHSHALIKIPKYALDGIYEPNACNCEPNKRKAKKRECVSPYYKIYRSIDKRRFYVYMMGGGNEAPYEVIWIIQDGKYYGRVVDDLSGSRQQGEG